MNGFTTCVGGGEYKITFETDNWEHYRAVENLCRKYIGHDKPYEAMLRKACKLLADTGSDLPCDEFSEHEALWEVCGSRCKMSEPNAECWLRYIEWCLTPKQENGGGEVK